MWQYVFLTLRRRRSQSMLASGGFLIAACALILLSATTQTTALHANQIIHQNWRPSYDLVVLPPTAHTVQGSTLAADSLQGYNGGISLKQYSQIQAIPGVEVAAPLAFIGYIQLPSPFLQFTSTPLSAGYYRVDWTLMAFNGQHHIVERQASFIYGLFKSCDTATNGINETQMQELQQHHVVLGGCGADLGSNGSYFSVPSLDTGTFLLAAVTRWRRISWSISTGASFVDACYKPRTALQRSRFRLRGQPRRSHYFSINTCKVKLPCTQRLAASQATRSVSNR